nr:MAG: DNA rep protein helicase [Chemarfal virus 4]
MNILKRRTASADSILSHFSESSAYTDRTDQTRNSSRPSLIVSPISKIPSVTLTAEVKKSPPALPELQNRYPDSENMYIQTPYENLSDYDDSSEWQNSPDSYITETAEKEADTLIKCKNAENCKFIYHDSKEIAGGHYPFDIKSEEYYLETQKYHDFLRTIAMDKALTTVITFRKDYKEISINEQETYLSEYLEPVLRNLSVTSYIAVWEKGEKEDYQHIHLLLQTRKRSDKLRKALDPSQRNLLFSHGIYTSLADLKTVKNVQSTWSYFMKSPLRIMSNSDTMLTMAWLHISSEYEKWVENPEGKGTITQRCTNLILYLMNKHKVYTLEELSRQAQQEILPFAGLASLQHIISNCRTILHGEPQKDLIELAISTLEKDITYDITENKVRKYLVYQGIDPNAFGICLIQWLQRRGKHNTLVIEGPPDTGKSTFIRTLLSPLYRVGEITNSGDFMYMSCTNKDLIQWEEPCLTHDKVEKFKLVAEGICTMVQVKHKENTQLRRTPLIITTNYPVWRYCTQAEPALTVRMHITSFKKPARKFPDWLKLTNTRELPPYGAQKKKRTENATVTRPVPEEKRLQDSTIRIHYGLNTRISLQDTEEADKISEGNRSTITTSDWQKFINHMYRKFKDSETL